MLTESLWPRPVPLPPLALTSGDDDPAGDEFDDEDDDDWEDDDWEDDEDEDDDEE